MIHQDVLDKNEMCYALLSSYNEPNMLIPIQGLIDDIKFDYDEPNYLIRIEKFYDPITFLKEYVNNMYFYTKFNQIHKKTLNLGDYKNEGELRDHLENNNIVVVVHSLMTFKRKDEMQKVFDKMNFYFILLGLLSLKDNLTRGFYKGPLKFRGRKNEFYKRLNKFIGDKFPTDDGIRFEDIIRDIKLTKPMNSLRYEKLKRTDYIKKV